MRSNIFPVNQIISFIKADHVGKSLIGGGVYCATETIRLSAYFFREDATVVIFARKLALALYFPPLSAFDSFAVLFICLGELRVFVTWT